MSDDPFIVGIKSKLANTKNNLEALETGHFRDDTTDAKMTWFKRNIANYELIVNQAKKS
jgi:hypothetical protein